MARSVCPKGRGMIELVPKVITIVRDKGGCAWIMITNSLIYAQACYGRASKLYGVCEHLLCVLNCYHTSTVPVILFVVEHLNIIRLPRLLHCL